MLDETARSSRVVHHLALQKLLEFAHALFLIENKRPLVSGYFEAWKRFRHTLSAPSAIFNGLKDPATLTPSAPHATRDGGPARGV